MLVNNGEEFKSAEALAAIAHGQCGACIYFGYCQGRKDAAGPCPYFGERTTTVTGEK